MPTRCRPRCYCLWIADDRSTTSFHHYAVLTRIICSITMNPNIIVGIPRPPKRPTPTTRRVCTVNVQGNKKTFSALSLAINADPMRVVIAPPRRNGAQEHNQVIHPPPPPMWGYPINIGVWEDDEELVQIAEGIAPNADVADMVEDEPLLHGNLPPVPIVVEAPFGNADVAGVGEDEPLLHGNLPPVPIVVEADVVEDEPLLHGNLPPVPIVVEAPVGNFAPLSVSAIVMAAAADAACPAVVGATFLFLVVNLLSC